MPDPSPEQIDAFIARWEKSGGHERGAGQQFLLEFCDLLGLDKPDPPAPENELNTYTFERRVDRTKPDGSSAPNWIDLFKGLHFVLETKQGVNPRRDKSDPDQPLLPALDAPSTKSLGHGHRGSSAWDKALDRAHAQGKRYIHLLPPGEPRPPFLIVCDVGHCFDLYAEFTGSGAQYEAFPDPRRRNSIKVIFSLAKRRRDVIVPDMPTTDQTSNLPGMVRDAILEVLRSSDHSLSPKEIHEKVSEKLGSTPSSSIRSYLQNNIGTFFVRVSRGRYAIDHNALREPDSTYNHRDLFATTTPVASKPIGLATVVQQNCLDWLEDAPQNSIHAIITDPPYGLVEYTQKEQTKLRIGKGGVWRIPPSFDGHIRSPLPRFTTLSGVDLERIAEFFELWGRLVIDVLVPGANVIVATNPLVSHIVSTALAKAGLERRGEIARLVMTMRGGDRPKAAHHEFPEVSVMPRSMWEPWLVFRNPVEGRIQDNLRKWKTGGFRRPSEDRPFGDVIHSAPTRPAERKLAPHPSLKPQDFLRKLVRGVLPLGEGVVLDPFAGAGSTLAAANKVGYRSIGLEIDPDYFNLSLTSIPALAALEYT